MKRLVVGLLLCVGAVLSYYAFFSRFVVTRDVPWVPFLLFAVALYLMITGWRRTPRRVLGTVVMVAGLAVIGGFTFLVTGFSRMLPGSSRAPAVGQQAPAFTLPDTNNRPVALHDLLNGSRGALIIFYRGYW